jgi:hypothetical protein
MDLPSEAGADGLDRVYARALSGPALSCQG